MATYLDGIVAWHRDRAAADERDLSRLGETARLARASAAGRSFEDALRNAPGVAVIAEIKRRSPSKGEIAESLDAASTARAYEAGGAACLSVLTDTPHFDGSVADLVAAREAVALPVLRKDFTVWAGDVYDAALMGADAVLLIVAVLSDDELSNFLAEATTLGLAALVEVHDEAEVTRALHAGAGLIGVNQRDLRTFEVDPERALRVAAVVPRDVLRVAESGITEAGQIARLADAGFDGVLIGESLLRAPDRAAAVRAFTSLSGSAAR
ncbi:MAG: indole-3-glycerol phosphate synthase TrpC [Acidimicrobiales bacterium]